jgi:hypothetical protein
MSMPAPRGTMRAVLVLAVATALAGALLPAAVASAAARPVGHLDSATQAANGRISVSGWAYDPGKPASFSGVDIYVDARLATQPAANHARPDVDRARKISGKHGFASSFAWRRGAHVVRVFARPLGRAGGRPLIGLRYLNGYRPAPPVSPGARIVTEAKKVISHGTPYVHGGTSLKTGFDCSGYTRYVYQQAHVASLARTAEQQRHGKGMRIIRASQARAGDLVFYLSGGSAYHIAIYAGNGMQYAAATPAHGIRYQGVWSSAVQYGTDWH